MIKDTLLFWYHECDKTALSTRLLVIDIFSTWLSLFAIPIGRQGIIIQRYWTSKICRPF